VGDYRIDHTIGVGGMAVVYHATQPLIGKRVALKVLHRHLCRSENAVARFFREARAVNQIGHPNIVDVFGCGTTEDGRAYLVMELLVGETLATRMNRERVSLVDACDALIEVAHALEAAHEVGIVHRDLKPDNIFLASRRGVTTVKLVDFGIAKLTMAQDADGVDPTRPGVLLGTPRYVSPEQVRGAALDGRTDIYSLGVVAFELFTNRPLFVSDDPYEMLEKHAKLRPPPPSAFDPALPARADELVGAMLDKDPAKRPTLATVRDALIELRTMPTAPVGARVEQPTEPVGVVRPDPSAVTPTLVRTAAQTRPVTRRRSLLRWGVPLGIAAIATGIGAAIAVTDPTPATVELSRPAPAAAEPPPPPSPPPPTTTATPPAEPPPVEMDPVDAKPVPKPPPRKHAVRSEPKPPATRPVDKSPPAARPVDKSPPAPRPVDKSVSPPAHPPEDDDAVRSPFERKP
jgi:serine/threonine-protein kinase